MHSRYATIDNLRRLEDRQAFQPKAGRFYFAVSELPRLDDLIRLAPAPGHETDRVFDGDLRDVGIGEQHEEVNRIGLLSLCLSFHHRAPLTAKWVQGG